MAHDASPTACIPPFSSFRIHLPPSDSTEGRKITVACREIGDGGSARRRPEREKGDRWLRTAAAVATREEAGDRKEESAEREQGKELLTTIGRGGRRRRWQRQFTVPENGRSGDDRGEGGRPWRDADCGGAGRGRGREAAAVRSLVAGSQLRDRGRAEGREEEDDEEERKERGSGSKMGSRHGKGGTGGGGGARAQGWGGRRWRSVLVTEAEGQGQNGGGDEEGEAGELTVAKGRRCSMETKKMKREGKTVDGWDSGERERDAGEVGKKAGAGARQQGLDDSKEARSEAMRRGRSGGGSRWWMAGDGNGGKGGEGGDGCDDEQRRR